MVSVKFLLLCADEVRCRVCRKPFMQDSLVTFGDLQDVCPKCGSEFCQKVSAAYALGDRIKRTRAKQRFKKLTAKLIRLTK